MGTLISSNALADSARRLLFLKRRYGLDIRGKAHLATNINSKQGASGPIPMSVPVVLVQMHWPLHLIAMISPDLPRSQHANTDISGDLALV